MKRRAEQLRDENALLTEQIRQQAGSPVRRRLIDELPKWILIGLLLPMPAALAGVVVGALLH